MRIVIMCPKCGWVRTPEEENYTDIFCEYCGTKTGQIDFDEEEFNIVPANQSDLVRERIYNLFLFDSPQFDKETFEKRLADKKKEREDMKKVLDANSRALGNKPQCPYCNSYYVEKITTGGRLISVALFGLGSGKIGNQWHCQICDSDF